MSKRDIDYGNDKLNEIFDLTWPNLGWAKRMEHNLPDKDDAPWLESNHDGFMTHEEMLEEAERREESNKINAHQLKQIDEMSREERVQAAINEVWYLVQGGQDGREYANSILFIVRVLESLK